MGFSDLNITEKCQELASICLPDLRDWYSYQAKLHVMFDVGRFSDMLCNQLGIDLNYDHSLNHI